MMTEIPENPCCNEPHRPILEMGALRMTTFSPTSTVGNIDNILTEVTSLSLKGTHAPGHN